MTSAAERFLVDFHARHAGATTVALGGWPVRCEGARFDSSYDLLVAQVPADARRVLDLACGDGYLLSRLFAARTVEATGIDMSAAELAKAHDRLQGKAKLVEGRAQALPFEEGAFDAVLSHMALMLMEEPATVLSQLRRVLRGGGQLAAVVGGAAPPSPAFEAYWSLMRPLVSASPGRVAIGDGRWRTPDGAAGLLRDAGFQDVETHVVDGELVVTPSGFWDWVMLMYDAGMVDEAARESVRTALFATLEGLADPAGLLRVPIRWTLVRGRNARRIAA